jgi:hypothetical protein
VDGNCHCYLYLRLSGETVQAQEPMMLYRRSPKSRFTPRNSTEVHRRFENILKKAAQTAEAKAKEHVAVLKTSPQEPGSWRRAGGRAQPQSAAKS